MNSKETQGWISCIFYLTGFFLILLCEIYWVFHPELTHMQVLLRMWPINACGIISCVIGSIVWPTKEGL